MAPKPEHDTTHFGFQQIPAGEKTGRVGEIFSTVAGRYDVMNDLMSFGLHRLWKRSFVSELAPQPGEYLLDLAGGTGDIARLVHRKTPDCHITLCDINPDMLAAGRDRAIDENDLENIEWITGNAEALPFPDRHFHACTIAFGIRNVTHMEKALEEIYRVLKPGGRFLCLEFSQVNDALLKPIYDAYSFQVIPRLGQAIAGSRDSYRYLVESIRRFPSQEDFAERITKAGFSQVSWHNLSRGVVAIHKGYRI